MCFAYKHVLPEAAPHYLDISAVCSGKETGCSGRVQQFSGGALLQCGQQARMACYRRLGSHRPKSGGAVPSSSLELEIASVFGPATVLPWLASHTVHVASGIAKGRPTFR